ncbi:MAG TPA: hypothetical protein VJ725_00740 [Thermoanaerobaculia bacterium]|nr:hypothetical protein [Thermoanaerobaculia bacterium]
MTEARSPAAGYLRFLVWATVVTAAVALLGYLPTQRLGGEGAIPAMLAGCVVGLLASLAGGAPVALGQRAGPAAAHQTMMLAMAVRFVAALALGLAVALSGLFAVRPLLVWIAIAYVALLVVDTWYAVKGF